MLTFPPLLRRLLIAALAAAGAFVLWSACTPAIGDKCTVSTDCSVQGDRLCDTSQPDGYCTELNCRGNDCFDDAVCVLFGSALPGCAYDDRAGNQGSRVARSFCAKFCDSNSDCRDEYYVCANPRNYPWNAVVLDDNQGKKTCLPIPLEGQSPPDAGAALADGGVSFSQESPICQSFAPADASVPIDAAPAAIDEAGSANAPPLFGTDGGL